LIPIVTNVYNVSIGVIVQFIISRKSSEIIIIYISTSVVGCQSFALGGGIGVMGLYGALVI
jgi:hypothetical protein